MSVLKGTDVHLWVINGEVEQEICCARNASLTTTADIGETSTAGTGKWKTYKGLRMSFTLSAGGLVSFDMNYSIAALRNRQINFDPVSFEFFGEDENENVERYSGAFIITSISTPTAWNSAWEYSVEGQGTGELTVEILTDTHVVIDSNTERINYE
jgi:hypothetical protein